MTTPAMVATKDVAICREGCLWTLYRKFKCFRKIQPDEFRVIDQSQDKKILYATCNINRLNIVFDQPGHSELEANKPLRFYSIKLNESYLRSYDIEGEKVKSATVTKDHNNEVYSRSYDIEGEKVKSATFTKDYNLAANWNKTQANKLLDIFIDSFHCECRLAVID
jgi:hypothetical protein